MRTIQLDPVSALLGARACRGGRLAGCGSRLSRSKRRRESRSTKSSRREPLPRWGRSGRYRGSASSGRQYPAMPAGSYLAPAQFLGRTGIGLLRSPNPTEMRTPLSGMQGRRRTRRKRAISCRGTMLVRSVRGPAPRSSCLGVPLLRRHARHRPRDLARGSSFADYPTIL